MNTERVLEALNMADAVGYMGKDTPLVILAEAVRELAWCIDTPIEEVGADPDRCDRVFDLAAYINEPQPVAICDDCGELLTDEYDEGRMMSKNCGKSAVEVEE